MAKKETVDPTVTPLTKSQARVMNAICVSLGMEPKDKKLIASKNGDKIKGPVANLSDAEGKILLKADGIDIPKVCRQMHREDLVIYGWNEDRSRYVGITEEGFKALQVPPREKKKPEPKEPKEPKAVKSEKASAEPKAAKTGDDGKEIPSVKPNPLMNNFIIQYKGQKHTIKAKDKAEFNAMKTLKPEQWIEKLPKK